MREQPKSNLNLEQTSEFQEAIQGQIGFLACDVEFYPTPTKHGLIFFRRPKSLDPSIQNKVALYILYNEGGEKELFVPEEGTFDLDERYSELKVAPDESSVTFHIRAKNENKSRIVTVNLENETVSYIENEIPFPSFEYLKDSKGLAFSKNITKDGRIYRVIAVRYFETGEERIIFNSEEENEDYTEYVKYNNIIGANLSSENTCIISEYDVATDTNNIYLIGIDHPDQKELIIPFKTGAETKKAVNTDEGLYLLTAYNPDNNDGSISNYQLLKRSKDEEDSTFEVVIPADQDEGIVLSDFMFVDGSLVLLYKFEGASILRIVDEKGARDVRLPSNFTSISRLSFDRQSKRIYFTLESFLFPKALFYVSLMDEELRAHPVNPELNTEIFNELDIKRDYYSSFDGTKIPITRIRNKEFANKPPAGVVAYIYAGYNVLTEPAGFETYTSLLNQGYEAAVIHARGGGERGRNWHQNGLEATTEPIEIQIDSETITIPAGMMTTVVDYIFGISKLKNEVLNNISGYGGSHSGMTVSVAAMLAPQLFEKIVLAVPLVDLTTAGHYDKEYRHVKDNLERHSPLHILQNNWAHPQFKDVKVLMFYGLADTRVNPEAQEKFIKALEENGNIVVAIPFDKGHDLERTTAHIRGAYNDIFLQHL